jgi:hypothetical protein
VVYASHIFALDALLFIFVTQASLDFTVAEAKNPGTQNFRQKYGMFF